ncbi:ParB/RepB/Spo0J family partition protein [Porphyromonas pogonae]|uniref:ParB/RepB/Spo0J family partition protein n=1 Tax=Porphyromonas pogonae TaxID=867595 RepID=UPI002E763277|nr:ParB/RepB/Spo0J family partition protein [Porphyromonas pogonae]
MTKQKNKFALGRGLDSLLGGEIAGTSSINEIPLNQIEPNPNQPRKEFTEDTLHELASSIQSLGLVQPITLQEISPGRYMIISGERRWRASQMAGLDSIPAYIKTVNDENVMEMALVENIQREDLNAIEVALAYQNLLDHCGLTQEDLGKRVGKKRATISNYLRLLRLPAEIQLGLTQRKVDMGHARALLQISDTKKQLALYSRIIHEGLSVRAVEKIAREMEEGEQAPVSRKGKPHVPEEYKLLAGHLTQVFHTKVAVDRNDKGKGKLTIAFDSDDELERIMLLMEKIHN